VELPNLVQRVDVAAFGFRRGRPTVKRIEIPSLTFYPRRER